MERHVALVAHVRFPEVLHDVRRPLVGFGEQCPPRVLGVDDCPALLEKHMGLGQVLAVGALPLEQIGHGVQPEAVDSEVQPEPQHVDHRVLDVGIVVVQVRLMGEEAMPVVLLAHRIPRPIGRLRVDEDDARLRIPFVTVRPHVEVAVRAVGVGARLLEPCVRVGRVVHDQVRDDSDPATVRLIEELDEVVDRPELGEHGAEVADVVSAVAQRRIVERWQPQAVDAEPGQVVEFGRQPPGDRPFRRRRNRRTRGPEPRRTPRS